jgi:hypothetical protein
MIQPGVGRPTDRSPMKTSLTKPRCHEFSFPYLDALVLVEVHGDSVEIRATRNTFSEQRKISFIRELAAEGFIDDSFQWFSLAGSDSYLGVRWRVDFSWLELPKIIIARARRFMMRLLLGGFLFWAAQIICLVLIPGR